MTELRNPPAWKKPNRYDLGHVRAPGLKSVIRKCSGPGRYLSGAWSIRFRESAEQN